MPVNNCSLPPSSLSSCLETNVVLYFAQHDDQHSIDCFDTTNQNASSPVPLTHVYHATASRSLSTSLPVTPANTITEVDSAYCPQCLASWDASAAFSTAKGVCIKRSPGGGEDVAVGCVSCPECQAILKIGILEEKCCVCNFSSDKRDSSADDKDPFTHVCVYKCGYCQWDSSECGLYRTLHLKGETIDLSNDQSQSVDEIIREAMETLEQDLTQELFRRRGTSTVFQALQSCWMNKNTKLHKMRRMAGFLRKQSSMDAQAFATGEPDCSNSRLYIANEVDLRILQEEGQKQRLDVCRWDVETLEEAVKRRKNQMANEVSKSISMRDVTNKSIGLDNIEKFDETGFNDDDDCIQILNNDPDVQARQQIVGSEYDPMQRNIHLPIPVSLRARAERRCIREIEAGRPGILLKPKVNPLEGDTSLRYGHGQWWKKDSSAIHSVPKVFIKDIKYNASTRQYALLLQLRNPTIGPIRLRMKTVINENEMFPDTLEVILDPLTFHKVHVHVIATHNCNDSPQPSTEQICLEAMEDAFLDVTKLNQQSPLDASAGGEDGWVNWASGENTCTLISEQNDVAWIQCITEGIVDESTEHLLVGEKDTTTYFGIPLKLEVEVSDDSWESSLIQVQQKQDNQKDFVSIFILPVWKHITC